MRDITEISEAFILKKWCLYIKEGKGIEKLDQFPLSLLFFLNTSFFLGYFCPGLNDTSVDGYSNDFYSLLGSIDSYYDFSWTSGFNSIYFKFSESNYISYLS